MSKFFCGTYNPFFKNANLPVLKSIVLTNLLPGLGANIFYQDDTTNGRITFAAGVNIEKLLGSKTLSVVVYVVLVLEVLRGFL